MRRLTSSRRMAGILCLGIFACSFLYQSFTMSTINTSKGGAGTATGDPSFNWRTLYQSDFSLGDWSSNAVALIDETYPILNDAYTYRDSPSTIYGQEGVLLARRDPDDQGGQRARIYIERPDQYPLAVYASQQITLLSTAPYENHNIRMGQTAPFDENSITWDSRVALGASGVAQPPYTQYTFGVASTYQIDGPFPKYMCFEELAVDYWWMASSEDTLLPPTFRLTAEPLVQVPGHMYLQAGRDPQFFDVKSPVLSTLSLKAQDVITIDFTSQNSHALTLRCLLGGIPMLSFPLVVEGNTNFSPRHLCITIPSSVSIDQLELAGDVEQGYVQIDLVRVEACHYPYITVDEPTSTYWDFRPPAIVITSLPGYIDTGQVFCSLNGNQYRMDQVGITDQFALQSGSRDWWPYFDSWQQLARGQYSGVIHVGDITGRYVEMNGVLQKIAGEVASLPLTAIGAQVVKGNYVFLDDATGGLTVVDITDKTNPVVVASLPSVQMGDFQNSMILVGDYLYCACVSGGTGSSASYLAIVDVSNPASPVVIGHCDAPALTYSGDITVYATITSLGLIGNYVYCIGTFGTRDQGLIWFDVTDPTVPFFTDLLTFDFYYYGPYEPLELGAYQNFLFIYAKFDRNKQFGVDVTDPLHPGTFSLQTLCRFTIKDHYLYTSASHSFRVYDISNPRAWVQVATLGGFPYTSGVSILGDFAFIRGDQLSAIDISVPIAPRYAGDVVQAWVPSFMVGQDYWGYCSYADSLGVTRWHVLEMIADHEGPSITLLGTSGGVYYSSAPPTLTVKVEDPHFNPSAGVVASLNGHNFLMANAPEMGPGYFKLADGYGAWPNWVSYWQGLAEGSYTLGCTTIDTLGNIGQLEAMTVCRDYTPPFVQYISSSDDHPHATNEGQIFGSRSGVPEFFISAADLQTGISSVSCHIIESESGSLVGDFSMLPVLGRWNEYGLAQSLDTPALDDPWDLWQMAWAGMASGYYAAIFQVTDLALNLNQDTVVHFCKDYSFITVSITNPVEGAWYSSTPSDFEIYMREPTTSILQAIYTFDNPVILSGGHWDYLTNFEWGDWPSFGLGWKFTGSIAGDNGYWAANWTLLPDGPITFTVFATDQGLNPIIRYVPLIKDTLAPRITVNSPDDYQVFAGDAPSFDLSIVEENGLADVWYVVDGGTSLHHLGIPSPVSNTYEIAGTVDADEWNNHLNEGVPVFVDFYAQDVYGHIAGPVSLYLWRDTQSPVVAITSPVGGAAFAQQPPGITFSFTDDNPDYYTYTIGGWISAHIPLGGSDSLSITIDQSTWDNFVPEGLFTIGISVYDKSGHVGSDSCSCLKDITPPAISIYSITPGPVAWEGAPTYALSRSELHPAGLWATWQVEGNSTVHNITLSGLAGTIPQAAWDQVPYGAVTLTFYSSDIAGNIGSTSSSGLVKKDSRPIITIQSPVPSYCYSAAPPSYAITVDSQGAPLAVIAYSFDNGATRFNTTELAGTFDAEFWGAIANGSNYVTFYAASIYGQSYSTSMLFEVDNLAPIIIINSPQGGEQVATMAPLFAISVEDVNLQAVYYSLDNGVTKTPIPFRDAIDGVYLLSGVLDKGLWDMAKSPVVTIQFYALDSYGNLRVIAVSVNRLDYKPRGDDLDFSLFFNMPWPVAAFCAGIMVTVFTIGLVIRRGSTRKPPTNGGSR